MSVWVTVPSARPVAEVEKWAAAWRRRGYRIALWRDHEAVTPQSDQEFNKFAEVQYTGGESNSYPGYAVAVNSLIGYVLGTFEPQAEWFVIGGDDVYPDPNHTAEEIARECREHFSQLHADFAEYVSPLHPEGGVHPFTALARSMTGEQHETFGVCQPTGDRWGEDPNAANPKHRSAYIDRVCGSAWIGREFARRINRGRGPLWPEYFHMSVDRELQGVALKYGVLWQRPDITQLHQHWGRPKPGERIGHASNMPEFLKKANEGMTESERLCDQREREGFPGSQPL